MLNIPEESRKNIYRYLGSNTDNFLSQSSNRIGKYAELWQLSNIAYMHTMTVNLLFSCESALYGSCVLKMCIPHSWADNEALCLNAYNGKGYCRLWAYSAADDVLLLEHGRTLRDH